MQRLIEDTAPWILILMVLSRSASIVVELRSSPKTSNLNFSLFALPMIRATKCVRLQARGLRFQSTTVRSLLKGDEVGKSVKVTGWIHSKRKHGKAIFLDVVDGSSHDHVQVVTHSLSAK